MMYCENCFTKVANTIRVCPKCGHRSFSKNIENQINQKKSLARSTSSLRTPSNLPRSTTSEARPWIRFWARWIDLFLFTLFCYFVNGFVFSQFQFNETYLDFLLIPMWIIGESFCLSNFQTTPGKALLKIRLSHESGKDINFADALVRSGKVAWRGLGLGFPIIFIITEIVAFNNLKRKQITSWDKEGNFVVTYEDLGKDRIILISIITIIFIGLVILGIYETSNNSNVYY